MNILANYNIPNLPLTEISAATLDHVYTCKVFLTDAAMWYSAFIKKALTFSFGDSSCRTFQIMFLGYENIARDLSIVCDGSRGKSLYSIHPFWQSCLHQVNSLSFISLTNQPRGCRPGHWSFFFSPCLWLQLWTYSNRWLSNLSLISWLNMTGTRQKGIKHAGHILRSTRILNTSFKNRFLFKDVAKLYSTVIVILNQCF